MTTKELDAELAAIPDEQLAELVNKEVKHLCDGNSIHMSVPVSKYDGDMLFCELLRRFKALRQAAVTPALGGWVSVKERRRLPEPHELVLIHHKENGIYVGYSTDTPMRSWVIVTSTHENCYLDDTDFWAPIPKLPPNEG